MYLVSTLESALLHSHTWYSDRHARSRHGTSATSGRGALADCSTKHTSQHNRIIATSGIQFLYQNSSKHQVALITKHSRFLSPFVHNNTQHSVRISTLRFVNKFRPLGPGSYSRRRVQTQNILVWLAGTGDEGNRVRSASRVFWWMMTRCLDP